MIALVDTIDEHGPAIEYDLMRCGSRLRDFPNNGVSWRDLFVLTTQAQPDSAFWRAVNPDWMWDHQSMLMAHVADVVSHFEWTTARGNPHIRGVDPNPPERIPRPGVEPATKKHGNGALQLEEMSEWLGGAFARES